MGERDALAVFPHLSFWSAQTAEIAEKTKGPAFVQFQQLLIWGQCEREGAMNRTKLEGGGGVCLGRKTEKIYSSHLVHNQNTRLQKKWLRKKLNSVAVFVTGHSIKFVFFNPQIDHIWMSAYTPSKFFVCLLGFHPNAFTAPTSPPLFGSLPCLVRWIVRWHSH